VAEDQLDRDSSLWASFVDEISIPGTRGDCSSLLPSSRLPR
jgi:hypothetical protein